MTRPHRHGREIIRLHFNMQSNNQPLTDAYSGFCERLFLI